MSELSKGPSRAPARHHLERIKAKVRRVMRTGSWGEPTPKRVGHLAAVHMRPCSCAMCQAETRRPDVVSP